MTRYTACSQLTFIICLSLGNNHTTHPAGVCREKGEKEDMARKYKRLVFTDRQQIEAMYNSGMNEKELAEKIGVHIATIYRELERGKVIGDCTTYYSADKAQRAIG